MISYVCPTMYTKEASEGVYDLDLKL